MSSVCVVTYTCVQLMNVAPEWSRSGGCHLAYLLSLAETCGLLVAEQHENYCLRKGLTVHMYPGYYRACTGQMHRPTRRSMPIL
jgi:hypothetical protein